MAPSQCHHHQTKTGQREEKGHALVSDVKVQHPSLFVLLTFMTLMLDNRFVCAEARGSAQMPAEEREGSQRAIAEEAALWASSDARATAFTSCRAGTKAQGSQKQQHQTSP